MGHAGLVLRRPPLHGRELQGQGEAHLRQVLTQSPTDRKFEELAIINAATDTGSFSKKNLSFVLPTLKERACEVGADAIVIRNVEQGGTPTMDKYGSQTPTKVFCVAIRFLPAR